MEVLMHVSQFSEEWNSIPDIRLITPDDPSWPGRMRPLSGMPKRLYYIGSLPRDDLPSVGIIGSRLCSPYGHKTAAEFGRILAQAGIQIISGMAVGVDGYAQEGALEARGLSFAVLGSGADVCYPHKNGHLYRRLCRQGGVLSELKPGTKPYGPYFAARNRIISALSDILLVVEAKMKSGTNITVDFALAQGKTVFAVPGRVGDHLSDGCNYLISQGAGIAYSPKAILDELKLPSFCSFEAACRMKEEAEKRLEKSVLEDPSLDPSCKAVFRELSEQDPLTADALSQKLNLPAHVVLSSLTSLILSGYAEEPVRGKYTKASSPLYQ